VAVTRQQNATPERQTLPCHEPQNGDKKDKQRPNHFVAENLPNPVIIAESTCKAAPKILEWGKGKLEQDKKTQVRFGNSEKHGGIRCVSSTGKNAKKSSHK